VTSHVHVHTQMHVPVSQPGRLALSVAVASSADAVDHLSITDDGGDTVPWTEVGVHRGGRMHVVDAPLGTLHVEYEARVGLGPPTDEWLTADEELLYRRPSRYCPSDRTGGIAAAELGWSGSPGQVAHATARWLYEQVSYTSGSTDVDDDAVAPLLTRHGVCRDFAHLGIAFCRSLGIPARYVSVYAPGLDPMDFHAVFEAAVDGRWLVFDGTMLAPRDSLVRIATGRDAVDTALLTPLGVAVEAPSTQVTVTVDPALPEDEHRHDVALR
jgi:transglutaminase-like putative cysteine protease